MPQLESTYFLSQFFWLALCFSVFYLMMHFIIIPRFRQIIASRNDVNEHNKTSAHMLDLELAEVRTLLHTKTLYFTESIQEMQNEINKKFQDYTKSRLEELNEELRVAHEKIMKEIAASEDRFKASNTQDLAAPLASHILKRLTGTAVKEEALTQALKG